METLKISEKTAPLIANNYAGYRSEIDALLAEGKVTGHTQTPERLEFTKLNIQRMNRMDKTIVLIPELVEKVSHLTKPQVWVMLAHGWCGDCAQLVPLFAKVASVSNGKIDLRLVNPDENPEIMDAYSTNGSRSVPKLVLLDAGDFNVLSTWGPRPAPAQEIMYKWKQSEGKISKPDFEMELHTWYSKDRTITTQKELADLLSKLI